jgi:hypothetical protein
MEVQVQAINDEVVRFCGNAAAKLWQKEPQNCYNRTGQAKETAVSSAFSMPPEGLEPSTR